MEPPTTAGPRAGSNKPLPSIAAVAGALIVALLLVACGSGGTGSEGQIEELSIDWAYYNPVSLVLKDKGWLDEELPGVEITWVQSAGSNKALEFIAARSVQFSSSAGAAALLSKINGNPIKSVYAYSQPEWTALVTMADSGIAAVEDLAGKKVAVTRGTDPHIFLVRALADHGLSESDIEEVLLQHADGRNALVAGSVDAWAGLDPMMAQAELEQDAVLFYRKPEANTWGVLNVNEDYATEHPEVVEAVIAAYERGRQWAIDNPDEMAAILADAAGLTQEVAVHQMGRTDLTTPAIGDVQRDSILGAGLALQGAGEIESDVDVEEAVDALLDGGFTTDLGAS